MSLFIRNPFLRVLVLVFFLSSTSLSAQVGIGTDTPAASAALEIQSTQKGFLISRMTQLQRNAIGDPLEALLVYQTDETSGFYYFKAGEWIRLNDALFSTETATGAPTVVVGADGSTVTVSLSEELLLALNAKEDLVNKSTDVSTDASSDIKYPSVLAIKSYVDAQITSVKATIDSSGTGSGSGTDGSSSSGSSGTDGSSSSGSSGTGSGSSSSAAFTGITSDTQDALDLKQDVANLSTSVASDGSSNSKYPSVKAVKDYVDTAVSSGGSGGSGSGGSGSGGSGSGGSGSSGPVNLASGVTGVLPITNGGTGSSTEIFERVANKSISLTTDGASDSKYPSAKAVKTYVDAQISSGTISEATTLSKGVIQLSGDLAGTATVPLVASGAITTAKLSDTAVSTAKMADAAVTTTKLADDSVTTDKITDASVTTTKFSDGSVTSAKVADAAMTTAKIANAAVTAAKTDGSLEVVSNKSTSVTTDGASDVKYPSVKAVKTYVDSAVSSGSMTDATTSAKGAVKLAGDLAGTADAPVIGNLKVTTAKLANNAVVLTSKVTGTLPVSNGGTGATAITGMVKGNGTSAFRAAVVGTDYSLVREVADEFTASNSQTSFTLSQTPSTASKVRMFINGVRISNSAYSYSGTTLTYNPSNNGSYSLTSGDRIQFDYFY